MKLVFVGLWALHVHFSTEESAHKKTNVRFKLPALTERSYIKVGACITSDETCFIIYTWERMRYHEVTDSHWEQSAVSRTCSSLHSRMRTQRIQQFSSTRFSRTQSCCQSRRNESTMKQSTAPDQPCSVHSSSRQSTALNHTEKSSSLCFFCFFLHGRDHEMNVTCFCSVVNAVLIKLISGDEESQRETLSLQPNVHTSSSMTRKSSVSERQQLLKV